MCIKHNEKCIYIAIYHTHHGKKQLECVVHVHVV